MLSVITSLEFFQHYFAKMGHRNTSCDPHLHQAIEQPMLPTSREASAAGRLRPNALVSTNGVVPGWSATGKLSRNGILRNSSSLVAWCRAIRGLGVTWSDHGLLAEVPRSA